MQLSNTQILTTKYDFNFGHKSYIDGILHEKYPHRNEKYYKILLKALDKLIQSSFKLSVTAHTIIEESDSARPTWYGYFRNVEDYYMEVFQHLSVAMLENTISQLKDKANFRNWVSLIRELRMELFLSNTKILVGYYPALNPKWEDLYEKTVDGYTSILAPILQLSEGRARLLIRNIVNEMVILPKKYYSNPHLFDRFVTREYILFLAEQNS